MRIVALILFLAITASAQILPSDRNPSGNTIPWQNLAGVPGRQTTNALIGAIPRTTIFATVHSSGGNGVDDSTTINNALLNCPSNQVVFLPDANYWLNQALNFTTPDLIKGNGITIRGGGKTNTTLHWTNSAFQQAAIEVRGFDRYDDGYPSGPSDTNNFILSVDSGYTQGSSNLVLHSPQQSGLIGTHQQLKAGTVIVLDQLNDFFVNAGGDDGTPGVPTPGELRPDLDTNGVWKINARAQQQVVQVQSITGGTNLVVWPPIMMTNWQSRLKPQIWWWGTGQSFCAIEDMTIDTSAMASGAYSVLFEATYGCWVNNVRLTNSVGYDYIEIQGLNNQCCHSDFADTENRYGSGSYGIAPGASGFGLIEDNWFYKISTMLTSDQGPVEGYVYAYNYCFQPWPTSSGGASTQNSPGVEPHFTHASMNLFEGNYANTAEFDFTHGSQSHVTLLRNQFDGPWSTNATRTVFALQIQATNWYYTLVGNVLGKGRPAFYTNYVADAAHPVTGGNNDLSVYKFGFPDDSGATNLIDTNVEQTVIVHLNWDSFTSTNGGIVYQPGITNRVVPTSYYLASQPSWWNTWGTTPWPPIGSDLSPQTNKLPAQLRFERATNGGGGIVYGVQLIK